MSRRGFWARLFRPRRVLAAAPEIPRVPQLLGSDHERWLEQLASDAAEGKRHEDIAGPEFFAHLGSMWSEGREQLCIEWLNKFLGAPSTPSAQSLPLRVRLVDYHEKRGELDLAVPHLELLTGAKEHALRAHYVLGEYFRGRGDDARALRHYEAVLGRDVDYPNVRARVERIRAQQGAFTASAGETLAGIDPAGVTAGTRYRLLRELGRGASGAVYLARDCDFDREVAIKLLHTHLAGGRQQQALSHFFREARVMASLRHPNIVAVLDLDQPSRRIVMELAAGGTLRDLLRERGPRTLRRALERHLQLLSALAAAHARGIVHRDVKPANLMFRRDPDLPGVEIMLGDFGVAHLPEEPASTTKAASGPVGTLAYMAPEQRAGGGGPGVDLYAAAVVLFEMLTGRSPWSKQSLLHAARTTEDLRLPAALPHPCAPSLLTATQEHLLGLGNPDPAQRPSTAEALAQAGRLRDLALVEDG